MYKRYSYGRPANHYGIGSFFENVANGKGLVNQPISSGASAAWSAAGNLVGQVGGNLIANGYTSGAGNAFNQLSKLAGNIPGPWGAVASAGLGLIGGGVNRVFGSRINQEALNNIKNSISALRNFNSNASTFDQLQNQFGSIPTLAAINPEDFKDGLVGHKAEKLMNSLKAAGDVATDHVVAALENNRDNLSGDQMKQAELEYGTSGGGGEIPSNTSVQVANGGFLFNDGGSLLLHGGTFDNGLTYINVGGTHEQNPNEGVQIGQDHNGVPNLVEEGEVIWNDMDYVFSNRLKVPRDLRGKYKLRDGSSFADAAKKINSLGGERQDNITMRGRNAYLSELMGKQEEVRQKKEQREQQRQMMQQQMMQQMMPEQMMASYGGVLNRFDTGGPFDFMKGMAGMLAYNYNNAKKYVKDRIQQSIDMRDAPLNTLLYGNPHGRQVQFLNRNDQPLSFQGGGAGGVFNPEDAKYIATKNDTLGIPITRTFDDAFAKARRAGLQEFDFDGKRYTTEMTTDPNYNDNGAGKRRLELQGILPFVKKDSLQINENQVNDYVRRGYNVRKKAYGGLLNKFATGSMMDNASADPVTNYLRRFNDSFTQVGENDFSSAYDPSVWFAPMQASGLNANPWLSSKNANVPGYYQINPNLTQDEVNQIEANVYNEEFRKFMTETIGNAIKSGDIKKLDPVALNWLKRYDESVAGIKGKDKTASRQFFDYDKDGNPVRFKKTWDVKSSKSTERGNKTSIGNAADYYNWLATDNMAGQGHNVFAKNGIRTFVYDKDGNRQYIQLTPEQQQKYKPFLMQAGKPTKRNENGISWTDYQLAIPELGNISPSMTGVQSELPKVNVEAVQKAQKKAQAAGAGKDGKTLPVWMRDLPLIAGGIQALTDLAGLTNRPDLSYANQLMRMGNSQLAFDRDVATSQLGDYMRYRPFDALQYLNQMNQVNNGALSALRNTSGGNAATNRAAQIAQNYNYLNAVGAGMLQAQKEDLQQYHTVKDFNKKTNEFNIANALEADKASLNFRQSAANQRLGLLSKGAELAYRAKMDADNRISNNLSAWINNMAQKGTQNFWMNNINNDPSYPVGIGRDGKLYLKPKTNESCNGGTIRRRRF